MLSLTKHMPAIDVINATYCHLMQHLLFNATLPNVASKCDVHHIKNFNVGIKIFKATSLIYEHVHTDRIKNCMW